MERRKQNDRRGYRASKEGSSVVFRALNLTGKVDKSRAHWLSLRGILHLPHGGHQFDGKANPACAQTWIGGDDVDEEAGSALFIAHTTETI